jgi:hypothetical protein
MILRSPRSDSPDEITCSGRPGQKCQPSGVACVTVIAVRSADQSRTGGGLLAIVRAGCVGILGFLRGGCVGILGAWATARWGAWATARWGAWATARWNDGGHTLWLARRTSSPTALS